MAAAPVFTATPKITPAAFTSSDSANTKKTIATAGSAGSKVVGVTAASTDSSTRIAQLWLTRSATSYLLASTTVAVTAGSDGATGAQDLMTATLWPGLSNDGTTGQRFFFLESGDTLQVSFTTVITAAKEIDVVAHFANF